MASEQEIQVQFMADRQQYGQLLLQNKGKNFVQRILNPNAYPSLEEWDGPGTSGTHAMSYVSGKKNKFHVYPEIIQDKKTGEMKYFGKNNRKAAWDYAKKTGEYITVDSQEEAEKFGSYGYKAAWGDPVKGYEIYKQGLQRSMEKKVPKDVLNQNEQSQLDQLGSQ